MYNIILIKLILVVHADQDSQQGRRPKLVSHLKKFLCPVLQQKNKVKTLNYKESTIEVI